MRGEVLWRLGYAAAVIIAVGTGLLLDMRKRESLAVFERLHLGKVIFVVLCIAAAAALAREFLLSVSPPQSRDITHNDKKGDDR